jgi:O-antigen/teichoic acid export membrane protein
LSQLRALAGQTAIYGLSSIVGRLLNYLLVPLYTRVFSPAEYGVVSEFYAYATFLMVIYSYGMETAFFHFVNRKQRHENVYGNAQFLLLCTTALFTLLLLLFSSPLSQAMGYANHPEYLRWFAWILAFDTLTTLPFARLRQQNRALRFALVKLAGIAVNIGLTLWFLWYLPSVQAVPVSDDGASYVFMANLVSSGVMLLLLLPQWKALRPEFDSALLREMLLYALPLMVAGFAGMINETLDRAVLKYLLPAGTNALGELGIYSACYKLSILMTLFVQTFRYAAEPFYFSQQHKENSGALFARVMNYFVLIGCVIFLGVLFYLDIIRFFIGEAYHSGLHVVPVLLAANLCLGIYLNLSVWYKLSGKTAYGAWLSVVGAMITLSFNLWLVPIMGYTGAAWATLACYASMMVLSWLKGQTVYPIPYSLRRLGLIVATAALCWVAVEQTRVLYPLSPSQWWLISGLVILGYFGVMWRFLGGWPVRNPA